MRVNGVMGVIAVACVVAVVNAGLGPLGRLHHRSHRTERNHRSLMGVELVATGVPPLTPWVGPVAPRLHRGGFVTLAALAPDDPDDEPDTPQLLLPALAIVAPIAASVQPHGDVSPPLPVPTAPPLSPPVYSFHTVSTAAIPEPATWGMMVLGFGIVAVALRRGRRGAAATWRVGPGRAL